VPPPTGCPPGGPAYPEVTRAICLVPSAWFPQTPRYALPVHLCRFRVRSICWRCFPDRLHSHPNPLRDDTPRRPSRPAGPGLFTWFPSATALALALGAGSPCADRPCAGTLGLPAGGVLALLIATHVRIRTSRASTTPRGRGFTGAGNAPLPRRPIAGRVHGFGGRLEPRYIFAAGQLIRPVSYYAFFKGWLLLSQPPGCFGRPTCFPTEPPLRGLSRWSGLFPSRRRTLAPAVCLPTRAPRHSEFGWVW
jgi:hypothetical protein